MPYISAMRGGLISIVVFALIEFLVPMPIQKAEGVEIILTLSTFLFAILVGFFIARLNSRYDQLRDTVAHEDALWLSLFEFSDYFDKSFTKKVVELIDAYYVISYDYELGQYYKQNAPILAKLYELFETAKVKKASKSAEIFDEAIATLSAIEADRNKCSVLRREGMTSGQWFIVLLLGGMIIFSMYSYGMTMLYFQVMTIILSSVVVMIILTIRDLHLMRLGGKLAAEESGEEVFEAIGKKRYYNQFYLKQGVVRVPKEVKEYRLGRHKPGEKQDIIFVKNKAKA